MYYYFSYMRNYCFFLSTKLLLFFCQWNYCFLCNKKRSKWAFYLYRLFKSIDHFGPFVFTVSVSISALFVFFPSGTNERSFALKNSSPISQIPRFSCSVNFWSAFQSLLGTSFFNLFHCSQYSILFLTEKKILKISNRC